MASKKEQDILTHINSGLSNKDITEVIQSWDEQQEFLHYELTSFWANNEAQFRLWWDIVGEDVRKG